MITGKDTYKRKSHIVIGELYFWTATINKWQKLLEADPYKDVIINSLKYLSDKEKIDVFAFAPIAIGEPHSFNLANKRA